MSDDQQTIATLRAAVAAETRGHVLPPAVTQAALDQLGRRRRRPIGHYAAVAAACVAVAIAATIIALTRHGSVRTPSAGPGACANSVLTRAIPTWARAGFAADAGPMPQVVGTSGDIVGLLFVDPPLAPPARGTNDKILWVAKHPGAGPLIIRAGLVGGSEARTVRVEGGPGPSSVNLTTPGCWRLDLSWSGHRDHVYLRYQPS